MVKVLYLLSFTLMLHICESYKILVAFSLPGKSHGILGTGVVNHLLKNGHEVTYITPFIEEHSHPNLRQIDVSANGKLLQNNDILNLKSQISSNSEQVSPEYMFILMHSMASSTLENENVQKLLQDPNEKFDLVIIEWMFSELLASLASVYNAPYIWLSTVEPHWMITRLMDESLNPAYNCDIMSKNFPPLNFLERVSELWAQLTIWFISYTLKDEMMRKDYEKLIAPIIRNQGREPPEFDMLKYNASLVLGNSHVSLGQATRVPQNYKPIAGYHIDENVKALPTDLQKIMDDAKSGVIYFSMGSNLKSKSMPEETKKSLLKMFGELKQTILWKFEDNLMDLPRNVHILEWAPQQSILAHPNCVLFISHGGLLSTTEAVHFGVPIIGIPVFGDQFINVERAVNKGFALKVTLSLTMHEELKIAIAEIVTNPSYTKKVKELSFVYHHRPVRPGAELVHWAEHVIQTNGAPHLKSLALFMPWYQKIYLDLVAVIVALLTFIVVVLKRLIRAYFCKAKIKDDKKSR